MFLKCSNQVRFLNLITFELKTNLLIQLETDVFYVNAILLPQLPIAEAIKTRTQYFELLILFFFNYKAALVYFCISFKGSFMNFPPYIVLNMFQ